jgi:hypothetical protein
MIAIEKHAITTELATIYSLDAPVLNLPQTGENAYLKMAHRLW